MTTAASYAFDRLAADWLSLRFDLDARARCPRLEQRVVARLVAKQGPVRILDLGCGSGSHLLHLSAKIAARQSWVLVDRDERIVEHVKDRVGTMLGDNVTYTTVNEDFTRSDASCLRQHYDLITANAVFDMLPTSHFERFIAGLAQRPSLARAPLYFTIHLDRGMRFAPEAPGDEKFLSLYNRHMAREQAFGHATGERAVEAMEVVLRRHGYEVVRGASPWQLEGAADAAAMLSILDFFDKACHELVTSETERQELGAWLAEKRTLAAAGKLSYECNHADLLATRETRPKLRAV